MLGQFTEKCYCCTKHVDEWRLICIDCLTASDDRWRELNEVTTRMELLEQIVAAQDYSDSIGGLGFQEVRKATEKLLEYDKKIGWSKPIVRYNGEEKV